MFRVLGLNPQETSSHESRIGRVPKLRVPFEGIPIIKTLVLCVYIGGCPI